MVSISFSTTVQYQKKSCSEGDIFELDKGQSKVYVLHSQVFPSFKTLPRSQQDCVCVPRSWIECNSRGNEMKICAFSTVLISRSGVVLALQSSVCIVEMRATRYVVDRRT